MDWTHSNKSFGLFREQMTREVAGRFPGVDDAPWCPGADSCVLNTIASLFRPAGADRRVFGLATETKDYLCASVAPWLIFSCVHAQRVVPERIPAIYTRSPQALRGSSHTRNGKRKTRCRISQAMRRSM